MSKSVTAEQRKLAAELGIDVQHGMTRGGLSAVIGSVLHERDVDRLRLHSVPNEFRSRAQESVAHGTTAPRGFRRARKSATAAVAGTAWIARIGVRRGAVLVNRATSKWARVVVSLDGDGVTAILAELTGKQHCRVPLMVWSASADAHKPIYDVMLPPSGFIHEASVSWVAGTYRHEQERYVRAVISVTDRQPCELGGMYWREDAVHRLQREFCERKHALNIARKERARARAAERAVEEEGPKLRYCAVCGGTFVRVTAHGKNYRCDDCTRGHRKVDPRRTICTTCGTIFDQASPDVGRYKCALHRSSQR